MINETELLDNYKEDFRNKTGKGLKCIVTSLREGETSFTSDINFYKTLDIILNYTNWDYNKILSIKKTRDIVTQRGIINYILVHNGMTLMKIGFYMNRDHSTIIHSLKEFENVLDTDYFHQKLFREILSNLIENYKNSEIDNKNKFETKYLK